MITNFDTFKKFKTEKKCQAVMRYNKNMKGVDIMNQYCSYYGYKNNFILL